MAKADNGNQKALKGKLLINAKLQVVTGMHIGGGSDFAPIGAVDSPFVRDPLTHAPIIPGSSIKGKMRTLLAKSMCSGYVLNTVDTDADVIARSFGSSAKNNLMPARLQFFDLFLTEETIKAFEAVDTDTYIGEVKFENTISRTTGIANPRQIERVPAGAVFAFKLVYNVENLEELEEDMKLLANGFQLLQTDYLGGHGSRGYGRVKLSNFDVKVIGNVDVNIEKYNMLFESSGCL